MIVRKQSETSNAHMWGTESGKGHFKSGTGPFTAGERGNGGMGSSRGTSGQGILQTESGQGAGTGYLAAGQWDSSRELSGKGGCTPMPVIIDIFHIMNTAYMNLCAMFSLVRLSSSFENIVSIIFLVGAVFYFVFSMNKVITRYDEAEQTTADYSIMITVSRISYICLCSA